MYITPFNLQCGITNDEKQRRNNGGVAHKLAPKNDERIIMSDIVEPRKTLSSVWYMMPLFFGVIGGLIVWMTKKDDDHAKAKRMLVLGIVISILYVAIIVYSQITFYDTPVNTPQFLQDANYTKYCDVHFSQPPTNCVVKDQHGVPITEDAVNRMSEYCWDQPDGDGYVPCSMVSLPHPAAKITYILSVLPLLLPFASFYAFPYLFLIITGITRPELEFEAVNTFMIWIRSIMP